MTFFCPSGKDQQSCLYFSSIKKCCFLVCNEMYTLIGGYSGCKPFNVMFLHQWAMSYLHLMTSDSRLKAYQDLHEASSLSSCSEDMMVAILEIYYKYSITVELSIYNILIFTFTFLYFKKICPTAWKSLDIVDS